MIEDRGFKIMLAEVEGPYEEEVFHNWVDDKILLQDQWEDGSGA